LNMQNLLAGISLGMISGAISVLANISGSETTLGETVTIVVFASGLTYWIGQRLQRLEDKMDECATKLKVLPCQEIVPVVKTIHEKIQHVCKGRET